MSYLFSLSIDPSFPTDDKTDPWITVFPAHVADADYSETILPLEKQLNHIQNQRLSYILDPRCPVEGKKGWYRQEALPAWTNASGLDHFV